MSESQEKITAFSPVESLKKTGNILLVLGSTFLILCPLAFFLPTQFLSWVFLGALIVGASGAFISWRISQTLKNQIEPMLQAHRNAEVLLSTLEQGVVVINKSAELLPGGSASVKALFGLDPKGKTLYDLLGLGKMAQESVSRWLDLTFSELMPFEDMIPLAPKSYERQQGRYISLDYHPIYDSRRKLEKIMLIATDKTKERRLKDQQEADHAMANVVMTILRNRKGFHQFVKDVRFGLTELASELNEGPGSLQVEAILRNLHTIKSITAQFHVLQIHRLALSYETELTNIQSEGGHRLQEFVPVLQQGVLDMGRKFEQFIKDNEDLIGPIEITDNRVKSVSLKSIYKVSEFISSHVGKDSEAYQEFLKEFVLEDIANGIEKYRDLVQRLADGQGKVVDFQLVFSGIHVCMDSYQTLVSSLVHVFRNAVDHGVEPTAARQQSGKGPRATIRINFERIQLKQGSPRVRIIISDDGRGIDAALIRQRLIERRILDEERASKLSPFNLLQYVFHHGMSTRDHVTNISGRGIGLDTVKYEASKLGGTAWVESEFGKGTTLFIEIPIYETPVFRPVDLHPIRMAKQADQNKKKEAA